MISDAQFFPLLIAMALGAFACRSLGYFAMRFVPLTPRVQAALKATPISVMSAIIAMAALKGGPTEWAALAIVVGAMKVVRSDVGAAFCGIGFIALARYSGF
jgi:uncharacterized membrane protein